MNQTKLLLDLYRTYKDKVGTLQIKNQKKLWQFIADQLGNYIPGITAENCHNRSKVVDRNYKKYTENKTATGRGRRYFEYVDEMDKIFEKKKSMNPELLLSNEDIHVINTNPEVQQVTTQASNSVTDAQDVSERECEGNDTNFQKNRNTRKIKKTTAQLIREDHKQYYCERLKLEREKINEIKRRNDLIEQRNTILKEKNCKCCN